MARTKLPASNSKRAVPRSAEQHAEVAHGHAKLASHHYARAAALSRDAQREGSRPKRSRV